ncbi:MAG: hypothetical protein AAB426_11285 [Myxococcota bacterium]
MKLYRLTVFKIDDGRRTVDGAKSTTEPLPRACKKLAKLFGLTASVRLITDQGRYRRYSIGGGLAELETIVGASGENIPRRIPCQVPRARRANALDEYERVHGSRPWSDA